MESLKFETDWRVHIPVRASRAGDYSASVPGHHFATNVPANYSWHWNGEEPAGRAMQVVAVPLFPSVALDGEEVGLLAEAVFQYGDVPPMNNA